MLDRCYEHYGIEPNLGGLVTWARANGIPFPRKERGKPWSAYVAEWKAARSANGQPAPRGPAPKGKGPDYNADVGAALPGEGRHRD